MNSQNKPNSYEENCMGERNEMKLIHYKRIIYGSSLIYHLGRNLFDASTYTKLNSTHMTQLKDTNLGLLVE